jgi:nucleoside 2-deoxyribosyltransferase
MKIVICGSMSHSKEMVEIANVLAKNNHEVILPHNAGEYADGTLTNEGGDESAENKIKDDLIRDYFKKIAESDAVLIANFDKNDIKNYIGANSFLELGFAHVLNKTVYLYNQIPEMLYSDEIKAMQPIILEADLSKIKPQ